MKVKKKKKRNGDLDWGEGLGCCLAARRRSLHILPVSLWAVSRCPGFLPQSRNMTKVELEFLYYGTNKYLTLDFWCSYVSQLKLNRLEFFSWHGWHVFIDPLGSVWFVRCLVPDSVAAAPPAGGRPAGSASRPPVRYFIPPAFRHEDKQPSWPIAAQINSILSACRTLFNHLISYNLLDLQSKSITPQWTERVYLMIKKMLHRCHNPPSKLSR